MLSDDSFSFSKRGASNTFQPDASCWYRSVNVGSERLDDRNVALPLRLLQETNGGFCIDFTTALGPPCLLARLYFAGSEKRFECSRSSRILRAHSSAITVLPASAESTSPAVEQRAQATKNCTSTAPCIG